MIPDLFAGPGGWDVAGDRLGLANVVGFELDSAACLTRAAAGHKTVRADLSQYPVEALSGRVTGLIGSPVCTTFSAAGKRAGVAVVDVLDASIRDALEGGKTRAAHRREMAAMLRKAWWPGAKLTRAERATAIWKAVRSAALVVEPARFIFATRPQWVAMEQVPEVLPLWKAYAEELTRLGYSAWCGTINTADYGVAQTRKRAILIASRVRRVGRPAPTHYDTRKGLQLFGTPWVSMAEALGWGATGRPGPTVTAGGTDTGGAEPFARGGRDALEMERDAGRWSVNPNASGHMRGYERDVSLPSPSLTGQVQFWSRQWVFERPSTAVCGDPRIGRPGHKGWEPGGESFYAVGSVRVTVTEAAILQSFPAPYPWQGNKGQRYQQVGNAFPPLAAIPVLGEATGTDWQPVAERYAAELYSAPEAVA